MPRDQLRILLSETIRAERQDITGQIMSPVFLIPYDPTGELMPTAHVAINSPSGIQLISNVAIAANNHELKHAAMGSPIRMRRSRSGRLEIIGLDKRTPGTVYNYTWNVSTASLTSGNVSGFTTRIVNYGELASVTSIGYGQTPYGAIALYDGASAFVAIMWP